jgi:hypothetical protein
MPSKLLWLFSGFVLSQIRAGHCTVYAAQETGTRTSTLVSRFAFASPHFSGTLRRAGKGYTRQYTFPKTAMDASLQDLFMLLKGCRDFNAIAAAHQEPHGESNGKRGQFFRPIETHRDTSQRKKAERTKSSPGASECHCESALGGCGNPPVSNAASL